MCKTENTAKSPFEMTPKERKESFISWLNTRLANEEFIYAAHLCVVSKWLDDTCDCGFPNHKSFLGAIYCPKKYSTKTISESEQFLLRAFKRRLNLAFKNIDTIADIRDFLFEVYES